MGTSPQTATMLQPGGFTPRQEAAHFYGLFLRGHPADELRRIIDVPRAVRIRWSRLWRLEPQAQRRNAEMLEYRRQVLAHFDALIDTGKSNSRRPQ